MHKRCFSGWVWMLLSLAAAPLAWAGPEAMTTLAERYYAISLKRAGSGLPDTALQQRLAPLVGARLRQAFADAVAAEQRHVAATADGDKPALFEGDVLTGIYEGAQEVALREPVPAEGGGTIDATVIHVDPSFGLGHRHRVVTSIDRLRFGMENGEIRIVDIQTATDRPGPGPDGLVGILEDYIQGAPHGP